MKEEKKMDYRGIEPRTSRSFTEMRSERTTPVLTAPVVIGFAPI